MFRTEKARDLEAFVVEGEKKSFSECSSGCQSGWTLYLDYSQTCPFKEISADEDEEDDLSMLSDASSGPPNINQDDYHFNFAGSRGKRKRAEKEICRKQNREEEHNLSLEDTASCSRPLCFSKNTSSVSSSDKLTMEDVSELSGCFSANHFEVCGQEGGKNQL